MIAIVDYGMGNLRSVTNAFRHLDADVVVTSDARAVREARALVVPGVGAFGRCVENLKRYGLFDLIREQIAEGKPYLGICLGMQILLESSEETPGVEGMAVIKGRVVRFQGAMKIPHMGWNSIDIVKPSPILDGIPSGSYFYFVHSYFPEPAEPVSATVTGYGGEFTSSVEKGNIFACQFHPEKSQAIGLRLLRNFVRLCE
ncbi:MAG: imidazole glycerol phosphate synthase subunit HisH [Syntrophorhabdales bacterium]|jgi:glutamine amidotransferase